MDKKTARLRKAARAASQQDQLDDTPTSVTLQDDEDEFTSEQEAERRLQEEDHRQSRLDAFAGALAKKRKSAVEARNSSGIEAMWREDEEFYEGIDDANRGETVTLKPRDPNGAGGTSVVSTDEQTGSNVFLNITRAYVDFSSGRAADMLLPTDEPNWDLKETPMPDIIKAIGDDTPLPEAAQGPGMATYGQAAQKMNEEARDKVAAAKTRIQDWLEESQFGAEQRKQLKDAAKVGVGILKGPFPVKRVARAIARGEDGSIKMEVQTKLAPISKCISYWDLFPDGACFDDIHKGSYIWERDRITARQLRDLKGTMDADGIPFYIESAIDTCLTEGPQKRFEDDPHYTAPDSESYEIWYFHGVASAEDLAAAGVTVKPGEVVPVTVTMVNDRVIKAAKSTLDSGDFPYDVMVWQPREGHWTGIGVARQVRAPQRIINAGVRNLMDNAGLGAGPQFVISDDLVPMGKNAPYSLRPRKGWKLKSDSAIGDVNKAFALFEIPMMSAELLAIIQFAMKMAEDVTGLPMLLQGQQGQASDTVGGMQLLTNNSNTPLRAIAKLFDDRVTVPHLLRYYEWLLLYGPEESEKGEYVVAARGSSALFERDAQNQAILQMAPIVENPRYKINPEKWLKEAMKAQRLDPNRFQYSETEWAQIEEQRKNAPPPLDPRVQTAQIGAEARVKAAELAAGVAKERIARDTDRDTVYVQAEQQRAENDHEARMQEMALKRELAMLDYANREKLSLEQVKAKLADTAMKLQTQRELSDVAAGVDLHKHHNPSPQALTPPTEPAGRAPDGQAYQA